jgi:hypothetical protein
MIANIISVFVNNKTQRRGKLKRKEKQKKEQKRKEKIRLDKIDKIR